MAKKKKTANTQQAADTPANNIKFVGRDSGAEPFEFINMPGAVITLPDAKAQTTGFYHKEAGRIIQMFPALYKKFTEKGK